MMESLPTQAEAAEVAGRDCPLLTPCGSGLDSQFGDGGARRAVCRLRKGATGVENAGLRQRLRPGLYVKTFPSGNWSN